MFSVPSQPSEIQGAVKVLHLLDNSYKNSPRFSPGHEALKARRTCFISFIKLSVSDLKKKEKDDIRSAFVQFYFFMKLCSKFLRLEDIQPYRLRHFRALLRYENTLVDQSKRAYYPNYFIKNCNKFITELNTNKICGCTLVQHSLTEFQFTAVGRMSF